ncbi:MAG: hypothetical protein GY944_14365, partial [bacterium]|nr:hypothetical protein [bacterium]
MPEQVTVRFTRPPGFEHLSREQWTDKLEAAVADVEAGAARKRERTGRRVVGRRKIMAQDPFDSPKS